MNVESHDDTPQAEPSHHLRLVDLAIEGLPSERIAAVETEVRSLIHLFELTDIEGQDVALRIILSDEMAEHVNRIHRELGNRLSAPYSRIRESVVSFGITITAVPRPPLEAWIVVDSAPWSVQDDDSLLVRTYLLAHELGHVLQEARGEGTADVHPLPTFAAWLEDAAGILQLEFDADRVATGTCGLVLRDVRGEPARAGALWAPRMAGASCAVLSSLCAFVHDVQAYRITSRGLDSLYPRGSQLVYELLLTLAHALALCDSAEVFAIVEDKLSATEGYAEYLQPDWEGISGALRTGDRAEGARELVRIMSSILARIGLRIEDMPNGSPFVHVHEPLFPKAVLAGATGST